MKLVVSIVLVVVLIGGLYLFVRDSRNGVGDDNRVDEEGEIREKSELSMMMEKTEVGRDTMKKEVDEETMKEMMVMAYEYSGLLEDVTNGQDVRGINTFGESLGIARANFKNETYDLLAAFENLPDPKGSDFYEGWIVRRGENFSVISTGELEKIGSVYTNTYRSGEDLTDHDFYVLTLEPDDGNPAPADHILEGALSK